jgi:addiction module RelE/StbE family toxin
MYTIVTRNKRAERQLYAAVESKSSIKQKIIDLQKDPRRAVGAHKLKGKFAEQWSCALGYDLRMIYEINDESKELIIVTIGSHKIYR